MIISTALLLYSVVGYTTAHYYVGCFARGDNNVDMMNNYQVTFEMTVEMCRMICTNWLAYAIQDGDTCTCGHDYSMFGDDTYGDGSEGSPCGKTCVGGGDEPCGSADHFSVYSPTLVAARVPPAPPSSATGGDGGGGEDGAGGGDGADSSDTRCAAGTAHNCRRNNPCSPLCVEGQMKYQGNGPAKYVFCSSDGGCEEQRCGRGQLYDAGSSQCRARGEDSGSDRCSHERFNCDRKNPCSPLCDPARTLYRGPGRLKYVRCDVDSGDCSMETCPRGNPFSVDAQACGSS